MNVCNPETLKKKLIDTAHKLRLGQEAEGAKRLKECLDQLEPMLHSLLNSQAILATVPDMLAAQERHDWLSLADYLEYELPMLLSDKQV